MTAKELLVYALDATERQLGRALCGVRNEDLDFKATPDGLSLREHLEHLIDVAQATLNIIAGRDPHWDSYELPGASPADLIEAWSQMRHLVRDAVQTDDDEALKTGI